MEVINTIGRRKTSVARIYMQPGKGKISINNKDMQEYFPVDIMQIIVKTGPVHFTRVFAHFAGKTGLRDVALPASYFYPCCYEQRGTPRSDASTESSASGIAAKMY